MNSDRLIIQIYEIQTPGEAEMMIELGVDHIGSVVLSEESWKDGDLLDTVQVTRGSGAKSSLIPLFRDPDAVYRVLDFYRPDIVHFCDAIPLSASLEQSCAGHVALQRGVRARFPDVKIMRSIPIPRPGRSTGFPVVGIAQAFEQHSDFFLTDTLITANHGFEGAEQPVAGFVGITGKTCDWDAAALLVAATHLPVILAGGISPENVADGIRKTRPAGVDSCTATNATGPNGAPVRFSKDPDRVRRLVENTRMAMKTCC